MKTFIDKDLNGRRIQQNAKDGRSVEIDGDSRFLGHRFLLKQKLYGDKRCTYCGKWFHWQQTDAWKWFRDQNLADCGKADNVVEPQHCGSGHCDDYHKRYLKHLNTQADEDERKGLMLYRDIKRKGLL